MDLAELHKLSSHGHFQPADGQSKHARERLSSQTPAARGQCRLGLLHPFAMSPARTHTQTICRPTSASPQVDSAESWPDVARVGVAAVCPGTSFACVRLRSLVSRPTITTYKWGSFTGRPSSTPPTRAPPAPPSARRPERDVTLMKDCFLIIDESSLAPVQFLCRDVSQSFSLERSDSSRPGRGEFKFHRPNSLHASSMCAVDCLAAENSAPVRNLSGRRTPDHRPQPPTSVWLELKRNNTSAPLPNSLARRPVISVAHCSRSRLSLVVVAVFVWPLESANTLIRTCSRVSTLNSSDSGRPGFEARAKTPPNGLRMRNSDQTNGHATVCAADKSLGPRATLAFQLAPLGQTPERKRAPKSTRADKYLHPAPSSSAATLCVCAAGELAPHKQVLSYLNLVLVVVVVASVCAAP